MRLLITVALIALVRAPLSAQERVGVTIDYVGVEGLYLGLGADQGFAESDTLEVFASADAPAPIGQLVLTSVTRRRSVAEALGAASSLGRGDVVYVELPAVAASGMGATTVPVPESPVGAGPGDAGPTALAAPNRSAAPTGPRVDGRIAIDLDARDTRNSWAGAGEEVRRRFATPTTRLSLNVTDLPGGFSVRTNLRAAYRYTELDLGTPPNSVRAYELAAVRTGETVQLRLGRFYNPYESYSSYWDGILLRVGSERGLGAGVVAGFEPSRSNEGFSSDVAKATGFVGYAIRRPGWRYDTDVSFHVLRPSGLSDRMYGGWSQRLVVGPLSIDQRARVDHMESDGSWTLTQLRIRAGFRVTGPLRVRGSYGRITPGVALLSTDPTGITGPHRDEMSAGLALYGALGSLTVDGGRTRWEGEDDGWSVSGSGGLRVGHGLISLSGRHWQRVNLRSLSVAPGASFVVGSVRPRVGYLYYRTDGSSGVLASQAVDAGAAVTLARVYRITMRGQYQWGEKLKGTRVQLGIWRSF